MAQSLEATPQVFRNRRHSHSGRMARLTHSHLTVHGGLACKIEVRPGSGPIRKAGGFESMEHDLNDMMTTDDL